MIVLAAILVVVISSYSTTMGLVYAQRNNSALMSTSTTNMILAPQVSSKQNATTKAAAVPQPANKTFYVFTAEVPDVNETKLGIKADVFTLPIMEVNKGDSVTVHFYNLEKKGGDRHSFTIGVPYNIDKDLGPEENGIVTFKADHEGIFQYYCKYHEPAMTGQLVVSP